MGERTHRNLGLYGEQLIELANAHYRRAGIALVHKVPTEWKPLRRYDASSGRSSIVSAKVERKAAVDFLGNWRGLAVAFDCKENSGKYWRLAQLEPHQEEFLADWRDLGGAAFILLINHPTGSVHVLPYDEYERLASSARRGAGPTTLKAEAIAAYPTCPEGSGCPCDYLAGWQEAVHRGLARIPARPEEATEQLSSNPAMAQHRTD